MNHVLIVLAVVGLGLVHQALEDNPPWMPIAAFIAGGRVPADIPEGFAATATQKRAGFVRRALNGRG